METWSLPLHVPVGENDKVALYESKSPHKFQIGTLEFQGRRPTMEDVSIVHEFFLGSRYILIVGIFDGHGGDAVSKWLGKQFPLEVESAFEEMYRQRGSDGVVSGVAKALHDTFSSLDTLLRSQPFSRYQGSTACIVAIMDDTLAWSAHCGDTRAIAVSTSGKCTRLTTDHKPDVPSETNRIVALGGFVSPPPVARVQGMLSVSRSFGDFSMFPFIVSDPDIYGPFSLSTCGAIVIGCDGIFDVLTDDDVSTIVSYHCARGCMSVGLTQVRNYAVVKHTTDNVTLLIVNMAQESSEK